MKGVAIITNSIDLNILGTTITICLGIFVVFLMYVALFKGARRIILLKDYSGADKYIKLSGEEILSGIGTPVFKYRGEIISLSGLLIGVTNDINEWYLIDPKKTDLVDGEKCILKGKDTKKYYIAERLGDNYLISKLKVGIDDRNFECIGKVIFEFINIKI